MTPAHVAVAYSGGRDSSALLHATLVAAAPLKISVAALHVHHGLHPLADSWLEHCKVQCTRWASDGLPVTFDVFRAAGNPALGESVEAWARAVRYQALLDMTLAHGATLVLLAHHRRDQAETFLLQALRGSGMAGLSGMPRGVERGGVTWARPWLARPREEIEAYVQEHGIAFVDDGSNVDPRFARNRLRTQVWPALEAAFPQAETALTSSSQWAQDAQACLAELAAQDMAPLLRGDDALGVSKLMELTLARRSNVLRAWLKLRLGVAAPASLVVRLRDEFPGRRSARWPAAQGEVRLYRGLLRFVSCTPASGAHRDLEESVSVTRLGVHQLPGWGGCLNVESCEEGGVPLAWLGYLDLRTRQGAEQFQAGIGRPPRSLKKQYQSAGIAEWDRGGPLFYSGGQLVFVPGLGLDARVLALPGQAQVRLTWLPMAPG